MKKSVLYIVVLVILALVALYVYLQDQNSTLDAGFTSFGIRDRQKVDSLILRQGDERVRLHRRANTWYVNEHTYARGKAIEQFFNLLEDIRVEAPAPENNRDELLAMVRENPIHVQIYQRDRLIRNYLVEQSPAKKGHTYMMVHDSRKPFLMNLPGFQGDLASLFRVDPEYWRDRTLFDYSGLDLKAIEVVYPEKSAASFRLTYHQDQFSLRPLENKPVESFSSSKAARYFSYFGNVRFHSVITDDQQLTDSLKQSQPYCTIRLTDDQGNRRKLLTYRKKAVSAKDEFGQQSTYDLNFLYGRFEHSEEILLIKYTEIDPLLKEINYFREN